MIYVSISNLGIEKRYNVGEELVEERDVLCSLGFLVESVRFFFGVGIIVSVGVVR